MNIQQTLAAAAAIISTAVTVPINKANAACLQIPLTPTTTEGQAATKLLGKNKGVIVSPEDALRAFGIASEDYTITIRRGGDGGEIKIDIYSGNCKGFDNLKLR